MFETLEALLYHFFYYGIGLFVFILGPLLLIQRAYRMVFEPDPKTGQPPERTAQVMGRAAAMAAVGALIPVVAFLTRSELLPAYRSIFWSIAGAPPPLW